MTLFDPTAPKRPSATVQYIKGPRGEKGEKGDAGSEASVTKTAINTALGRPAATTDGTSIYATDGSLVPVASATALADEVTARTTGAAAASTQRLVALAAEPSPIVATVTAFDPVTGVGTVGTVRWPDGATGTYTATSDSFGVASYVVTHVVGPTTITFTQPTMTRDSTGRVVTRPAIVVS